VSVTLVAEGFTFGFNGFAGISAPAPPAPASLLPPEWESLLGFGMLDQRFQGIRLQDDELRRRAVE
jgi:hypothetical protein